MLHRTTRPGEAVPRLRGNLLPPSNTSIARVFQASGSPLPPVLNPLGLDPGTIPMDELRPRGVQGTASHACAPRTARTARLLPYAARTELDAKPHQSMRFTECKVARQRIRSEAAIRRGLWQTAGCTGRRGGESAHLVVFDIRRSKSREEIAIRRDAQPPRRPGPFWGMCLEMA